jgi:predicted transglutaminase-like cysteine proteinase
MEHADLRATRRMAGGRAGLRAGLVCAILLAASAYGMPAGAAVTAGHAPNPPLFGTVAFRSSNIALFPQWIGALARYFKERPMEKASCTTSRFNRCLLAKWSGFLKTLRGKPPMDQLDAINTYMNRKRYIVDPVNYGVRDYWATPLQFLSRNGDCEDYAIAKYMSLKSLGFKDSQMRIVVLQDLNLDLPHAILVVYVDGRGYALDNQINTVVPADSIKHYKPFYSINQQYWWLHRPAAPQRKRLARAR